MIADDIKDEVKGISHNLGIGDRINTMAKAPSFITLQDHEDNFKSDLKCRLINSAKSELGKVIPTKTILQGVPKKTEPA